MKKTYTMIDESNNTHYTTFKTTKRFFQIYGGNSVVIIDPMNNKKTKYVRLPDNTIIHYATA